MSSSSPPTGRRGTPSTTRRAPSTTTVEQLDNDKKGASLPCVAHPNYTFHQNCGCFVVDKRNTGKRSKSTEQQPVGTSPNCSPDSRRPSSAHATCNAPALSFFTEGEVVASVITDCGVRHIAVQKPQRRRPMQAAPSPVVISLERSGALWHIVERGMLSGSSIRSFGIPIMQLIGREVLPSCMQCIYQTGDVWVGLQDGTMLMLKRSREPSDSPNRSPPQEDATFRWFVSQNCGHRSAVLSIFPACDGNVYSCCTSGVIVQWSGAASVPTDGSMMVGMLLPSIFANQGALSIDERETTAFHVPSPRRVNNTRPEENVPGSGGGEWLTLGASSGHLSMWNVETAVTFRIPPCTRSVGAITALCWSPDHLVTYCGHEYGHVAVWAMPTKPSYAQSSFHEQLYLIDTNVSTPVASLALVQGCLWAMAKTAQCVFYDAVTMQEKHRKSFSGVDGGSSNKGSPGGPRSPSRYGCHRLYPVAAVSGQVAWYVDTSGTVTTYLIPLASATLDNELSTTAAVNSTPVANTPQKQRDAQKQIKSERKPSSAPGLDEFDRIEAALLKSQTNDNKHDVSLKKWDEWLSNKAHAMLQDQSNRIEEYNVLLHDLIETTFASRAIVDQNDRAQFLEEELACIKEERDELRRREFFALRDKEDVEIALKDSQSLIAELSDAVATLEAKVRERRSADDLDRAVRRQRSPEGGVEMSTPISPLSNIDAEFILPDEGVLAALRTQLATVEAERDESLAALRTQLASVEAERDESLAALRTQLATVEAERDESLAALRTQLATVEAERDESLAALRTQLASVVVERDESLVAIRTQLATVVAERDEALSRARDDESLAALRTQLATVETERDEALSALRTQLASVVAERDDALSHIRLLESENLSLQNSVFERAMDLRDVTTTMESSKVQVDAVKQRYEEALDNVSKSLSLSKSTLAQKEQEMLGTLATIESLKEENEYLKRTLVEHIRDAASPTAGRIGGIVRRKQKPDELPLAEVPAPIIIVTPTKQQASLQQPTTVVDTLLDGLTEVIEQQWGAAAAPPNEQRQDDVDALLDNLTALIQSSVPGQCASHEELPPNTAMSCQLLTDPSSSFKFGKALTEAFEEQPNDSIRSGDFLADDIEAFVVAARQEVESLKLIVTERDAEVANYVNLLQSQDVKWSARVDELLAVKETLEATLNVSQRDCAQLIATLKEKQDALEGLKCRKTCNANTSPLCTFERGAGEAAESVPLERLEGPSLVAVREEAAEYYATLTDMHQRWCADVFLATWLHWADACTASFSDFIEQMFDANQQLAHTNGVLTAMTTTMEAELCDIRECFLDFKQETTAGCLRVLEEEREQYAAKLEAINKASSEERQVVTTLRSETQEAEAHEKVVVSSLSRKLAIAEQRAAQAEADASRCHSQLQEYEEEAYQHSEAIRLLQVDKLTLSAKVASVEGELDTVTNCLQLCEQERQRLSVVVEELQTSEQECLQRLRERESENEGMRSGWVSQAEVDKLTEQLTASLSSRQQLELANEKLQREMNDVRHHLNATMATNDALTEELAKVRHTVEVNSRLAESAWEGERLKIESSNEAKLTDVRNELSAAKEACARLTAELKVNLSKLHEVEGERNKAVRDEEITALNSALDTMAGKLALADSTTVQLQQEIVKLEETQRRLQHDLRVSTELASTSQSARRSAENENSDLRREMAHISIVHTEAQNNAKIRMESLIERIESLEAELHRSKKESSQWRATGTQGSQLQARVVFLEAENATLQGQVTALLSDVDKLTASLMKMKGTPAVESHLYDACVSENMELKRSLHQLQAVVVTLREDEANYQAHILRLNDGMACLESSSEEGFQLLQHQIQLQEKTIEGLRKQVSKLKADKEPGSRNPSPECRAATPPRAKEGGHHNWIGLHPTMRTVNTLTSPNAAVTSSSEDRRMLSPTPRKHFVVNESSHPSCHDATDANHMAGCVWCSNRTVQNMGGTFGVCVVPSKPAPLVFHKVVPVPSVTRTSSEPPTKDRRSSSRILSPSQPPQSTSSKATPSLSLPPRSLSQLAQERDDEVPQQALRVTQRLCELEAQLQQEPDPVSREKLLTEIVKLTME